MKKIFALTLAALAVITLIPGLGAAAQPYPAVSAGMIIIGADDGRLYAFGEKK